MSPRTHLNFTSFTPAKVGNPNCVHTNRNHYEISRLFCFMFLAQSRALLHIQNTNDNVFLLEP